MTMLAVWPWVPPFLNIILFLIGLFLVLLVLIQRGKGGGLSGAFGGAGGSSAFGSRAGATFTKITNGGAPAWIILPLAEVMGIQRAGQAGEQNTTIFGEMPSDGSPPAKE